MDEIEDNCQLPSVLTIAKFSVARGKEIQVLNQVLSSSTGIKLAFQKLPQHMRRRAMSHNVKRLPRRLREIHTNQMTKSGLPPKQKRPSRKYRRRPYNLTSEYVRRQKKCLWLNTHIWHAKRFHMIEKWDYKLPYSPCDKSFRACYRATLKYCLLQDISYHSCLELTSNINQIANGLKKIMNPSIDISICAQSVIMGLREGKFTLLKYVSGEPIGTVYYFWRPFPKEDKRTLWLWIHAAFYNEALESIKQCFNLSLSQPENSLPMYEGHMVQLKNLKHEVSRFRLTGPMANMIILNAFKVADPKHIETESNCWVKSFLKNMDENYLNKMIEQWNSFKLTSSPAELSPHIVVPLIIQDPRFNLPKNHTKILPCYSNAGSDTTLWANVIDNPIWDHDIRKFSENKKPTQAKIAKYWEKLLVPGSTPDQAPALLPVTLIQRPGVRSKDYNGYGCGWDIILPSAWAQPVWLSLIMWGARSGGLRETDSVIFESNQSHFLFPDTQSGKNEENLIARKLKDDFFKLPPNKRPNYNKFGISSPFNSNWQLLFKDWGCDDTSASNFVVLRNKKILRNLQEGFRCKNPNFFWSEISENTLIPVTLTFCQKGACKELALICLPKIGDFVSPPVEVFHEDPNEITRKILRREHVDLLKRLRRKRQRAKNSDEKIPIDTEMMKSYSQKMKELWVPETTVIRNSCSREVMGFVKHGGFSFLLAKTKGVGYVTINSLRKLLEMKKNMVLVRNTSSRQYRVAVLDIICEN